MSRDYHKRKEDGRNEKKRDQYMGLVMTKPVFGVSDKVRFKPACSATEISQKNDISLVASLDMVLSKTQITKALIRLHRCAGLSVPVLFAHPRRPVFSRRGPYMIFLEADTCTVFNLNI